MHGIWAKQFAKCRHYFDYNEAPEKGQAKLSTGKEDTFWNQLQKSTQVKRGQTLSLKMAANLRVIFPDSPGARIHYRRLSYRPPEVRVPFLWRRCGQSGV